MKKNSLNNLANMFPRLLEDDMIAIKGGDALVDDLFSNIFVLQSNLSQQARDVFRKAVEDLASIATGRAMLQGLLASEDQINISGDPPSNPSASAGYSRISNTIGLGNLDVNYTDPFYTPGRSFVVIAHELFHAYQDNFIYGNFDSIAQSQYFNDGKVELDAGMFAHMAAVQYDIKNNLAYNNAGSYVRLGTSSMTNVGMDPNVPDYAKKVAFRDAWEDIFQNGNFTVANYNILLENFNGGSTYGLAKNTYTPVTHDWQYFSDDFFLKENGFIKDTALFKKMIEDPAATPDSILSQFPDIRNIAVPDPMAPFNNGGGSGSGGGGGGGASVNPVYNPFDPMWANWRNAPGTSGNTTTPHPSYAPPTWFDEAGNYHPEWGSGGNY